MLQPAGLVDVAKGGDDPARNRRADDPAGRRASGRVWAQQQVSTVSAKLDQPPPYLFFTRNKGYLDPPPSEGGLRMRAG